MYRWRSTLQGEGEVGGFTPILEKGVEYFETVYDLGLPEGGWASEELLDAAGAGTERPPRPRGGGTHANLKPLSGTASWVSGIYAYRLETENATYVLRRIELPPVRSNTGPHYSHWRDEAGRLLGERIAAIRSGVLHRAVADTVAESIRDCVDVTRLDAMRTFSSFGADRGITSLRSNRLATLDKLVKDAKSRYDGFIQAAGGARRNTDIDDAILTDLLMEAQKARNELDSLVAEHGEVESASAAMGDLGTGIDVEARSLARALGQLWNVETAAESGLNRAIREILHDFRLMPDGLVVRWSATIMLPFDKGVLGLRVKGTVPNVAREVLSVARAEARRETDAVERFKAEAVLDRLVWHGESLAEQVRFRGMKSDETHRLLAHDELKRLGLSHYAARALLTAPFPELLQVVYGHLKDVDSPVAKLHPDWADHIIRVYTDTTWKWPQRWSLPVARAQAAIDLAESLGGQATRTAIDSAVDATTSARTTRYEPGRNGWPAMAPSLSRVGTWTPRERKANQNVALLACPHEDCRGFVTRAIRVPETAYGGEQGSSVMCPTCRRLPVEGSPQFPDFYLHIPEGLGDHRKRYYG